MTPSTTTLGACPHCEKPVPQSRLLIEYETTDGTSRYAECPECLEVITPT